jgi:WD40 repeat protein
VSFGTRRGSAWDASGAQERRAGAAPWRACGVAVCDRRGVGSGANEARVYERESGELRGVMKGMQQGVYSLDCHPSMSQVAVASGDGAVRLYDYK